MGIGAFISGRATLTSEQGADRVQLARITANVFPLLGVSPARGRGFTEEEEHAGRDTAVVVSDDFWKTELGGAQDVIGRDLRINGERHTVVGVMPAGFSYPGPGISIWKPLDLNRRGAADRDDHSLQVIARIAPGLSMAEAQRDLEEISKRLQVELPAAYPARDTRWHFALESLRASQFGHMTAPLGLLATAAATVLLIACVNVSIMFLLRAGMRRREMTIRYALGAARHHLLKQLLTESALVCGLGAIGGVLIATFGLRALKVFSPDQIPRLQEVALNGPVAVFTGGVLMLVTLVVGLAPAVAAFNAGATGGNAATARTTDSRAAGRLREGLTVVEIALAMVLLVCAGLTVRSLNGLSRVDLGFAPGKLFAFKSNLTPQGHPDAARANRFYDQLAEKLERLPGVIAVGAVSYLPLSGEAQYTAATADTGQALRNSGDAPLNTGWRVVRGRYFEAMKMTLVRGRFFTAADREQSTPVVIVDDAFARKFWPTEDAAVGKTVRFGDAAKPDIRTVVGVVRRVKHFGPGADSAPEAYVPQAQVYQRGMYSVVEAGGSPANLAPLIRKALAEIDPTVPMYFADTLEQRRRATFTLPRFTAGLTGAFSALALILAGVGLFGVTAYTNYVNRLV
jgi:predicted permease